MLKSGRFELLLLAALCIAPVVASYMAFYFAPPARHINYGELLATAPLPRAPLELADGSPFELSALRGKWVLITVDRAACDDYCRQKLFTLRQLRLGLGKNSERLERIWLLSDDAAPPAAALDAYPGTWIVRAAGSPLLASLPAQGALADHVYLVDPLGNLVLRYARSADPMRMIKDLERLLSNSRIG